MPAVQDMLERIAERALASDLHVTTAESCTGGLIAKLLTDRPGSSQWFEYGFVTYSNEAKQALLGVDATSIATHGAVSRETVCAMAEGALARAHADYAVAVSGVAGPDGGTARNPVGSVWIACSGAGATVAKHLQLSGDRAAVRERSALAALELLYDCMKESP